MGLMLAACQLADGQVQLGPRDPGLRAGVLEHREREGRVERWAKIDDIRMLEIVYVVLYRARTVLCITWAWWM